MADRYLSAKFGLDPCSGSKKPELMDGRQTTDACATTVALPTESSRAKMSSKNLKYTKRLIIIFVQNLFLPKDHEDITIRRDKFLSHGSARGLKISFIVKQLGDPNN